MLDKLLNSTDPRIHNFLIFILGLLLVLLVSLGWLNG